LAASGSTGISVYLADGNWPCCWNQPAPPWNAGRRLHEQVHQRRVQILARHQRGGRRDQVVVFGRQVAAEIDDPARQHHMGQERQLAR
jgi:hypothetical protein